MCPCGNVSRHESLSQSHQGYFDIGGQQDPFGETLDINALNFD